MNDRDSRYVDCETCGERFWDDAIQAYMRTIEGATGARDVCIDCKKRLERKRQEAKQ